MEILWGGFGSLPTRITVILGAFTNKFHGRNALPCSRATEARGLNFRGQALAKPFMGFSGYCVGRMGLISQKFLSSGEGPSSIPIQATIYLWEVPMQN